AGSPGAGCAATRVPAGTAASVVPPATRWNVKGTRAGLGGLGSMPTRLVKARKFRSGIRLSRSTTCAAIRAKIRMSADPRSGSPEAGRCQPGTLETKVYASASFSVVSTRSSKVRGSIGGLGTGIVASAQVEGIHEVEAAVGRPDLDLDLDDQLVGLPGLDVDIDAEHVHPWLPADEGNFDLADDVAHRPRARGREDEVVDAAPEVRPHHALAGGGAEDEPDRLADVVLFAHLRDPVTREPDPRGAVGIAEGELEFPSCAEKAVAHDRSSG